MHYNDKLIDVRDTFNLVVFVNCDGKAATVGFDDNFFTPAELLRAYESLFDPSWNMDDEKPKYVAKFKRFLIKNGAEFDE